MSEYYYELLSQFDEQYRRAAMQCHPDHKPAEQQELFTRRMAEINVKYQETRQAFLRWLGNESNTEKEGTE